MVTGDSFIDQLIEGLQSLFQGQQQYVRPLEPAPQEEEPFSGGYRPPIHGTWHSSGGFTYQPNATHPKGHMGVDMRVPGGTPVYPLAPGVISNVGTDPKGGNVVNIRHADGVTTYYAHLGTVQGQKGDKVTTDTVIGTVGNTGNASHTFPHLHFQVWKDGQIQDPAKFFTVPAYTNLGPDEHQWLSEDAKQEAQAFRMSDHLAERRVAFSREVDKLLKFAEAFEKLTTLE